MKCRTMLLITMVIMSHCCLEGQNLQRSSHSDWADVADDQSSDQGSAGNTQDRTQQAISDSALLSITCTSFSTIVAGGDKGIVTYSSDGGSRWIQVQTGTINTIRKISFLNNLVGVAVGDGGLMLLTTDGGRTWKYQPYASGIDLFGVSFSDEKRIYSVGRRGTILRSNDSGKTWESLNSGAFFTLRSIKNLGSAIAVAVGVEGTIVRTSDSGNSWRHNFSGTLNDLNDASFANAELGITVGSAGTIVRTTDGGISWSPIQHPFSVDFTSVAFADVNDAVATASNGTIIHTNDGGLNWQLAMDSSSISLSSVSFADPVTGFIAGDNGIILHSYDGGAHWSTREQKLLQAAETPGEDKPQTLVRTTDATSEKESKSVNAKLAPEVAVSKTKATSPIDIQSGPVKMAVPRWKPFDLSTMLIQVPAEFGGGFVFGLAGVLLGSVIDGKSGIAATVILGGGGAFFGVPAGVYFGGKWKGGNGTYESTLYYGYGILLCGALLTVVAPPLGVIVMILSPVLGYHLSASPIYESDYSTLRGSSTNRIPRMPHPGPTMDLTINLVSLTF